MFRRQGSRKNSRELLLAGMSADRVEELFEWGVDESDDTR